MLKHQCVAQGTASIIPVGFDHIIYESIPESLMPVFDPSVIKGATSQHKDPRVAYNFETSFTPYNSGEWKVYGEKIRTWHLKLKSSGAYGMALVLSKVTLRHGERLSIFNRTGIIGSYSYTDIPKSGILPHDFLKGDEIVIEYNVPIGSETGNFEIEKVSHAYVDLFAEEPSVSKADPTLKTPTTGCYLCIEDEKLDLVKRSVVKMIVHFEDATLVCTGSLLNNTTRDKKPLILTAQHCIDGDYTANRTVFIFNYENELCEGSIPVETHKLTGASYLTSSYENDFSLVELNHYPPLQFRPYYAGWNLSEKLDGAVISIHHPRGGPKQVSFSNESVTSGNFAKDTSREPNAFWKVTKWSSGITEGGSSGAPLFNHSYQIIGTLTGGSAECDYPYSDYFEKLSSTWKTLPELRYWLDPMSLKVNSLEGFDPFSDITPQCDTASNIKTFESKGLQPYTPGSGYYSGRNSANIVSYAEKFLAADSSMLTGALFSIGRINTNAVGGLIVTVSSADVNGLPGTGLYESYIPYYRLIEGSNYIEFYPYVKLKGNFFITYTISGLSDDIFALSQAAWRNNGTNTAFVKLASGWKPITQISPGNAGSSFGIDAILCDDVPENPGREQLAVEVYPNPASELIVCKLLFSLPNEYSLKVYDLQGKAHDVNFHRMDNNLVIYTSKLSSGMYIVRLTTPKKVYTTKFFKGDIDR